MTGVVCEERVIAEFAVGSALWEKCSDDMAYRIRYKFLATAIFTSLSYVLQLVSLYLKEY